MGIPPRSLNSFSNMETPKNQLKSYTAPVGQNLSFLHNWTTRQQAHIGPADAISRHDTDRQACDRNHLKFLTLVCQIEVPGLLLIFGVLTGCEREVPVQGLPNTTRSLISHRSSIRHTRAI